MGEPSGPRMAPDDDERLIARSLAGDQGAFEDLVRRYEGRVFRLLGRFCRRPEDIEDLAQEVFLKVYQGLAGFRRDAPFGPWLGRVTVHVAIDHLRKVRRRPETFWDDLSPAERAWVEQAAGGATSAESAAAGRELAHRALDRLSPTLRAALLLREVDGLSFAEVGRVLGCSALAARMRVFRGRLALRRIVEGLLEGRGRSAGEGKR